MRGFIKDIMILIRNPENYQIPMQKQKKKNAKHGPKGQLSQSRDRNSIEIDRFPYISSSIEHVPSFSTTPTLRYIYICIQSHTFNHFFMYTSRDFVDFSYFHIILLMCMIFHFLTLPYTKTQRSAQHTAHILKINEKHRKRRHSY